jgi:hypothetical protein
VDTFSFIGGEYKKTPIVLDDERLLVLVICCPFHDRWNGRDSSVHLSSSSLRCRIWHPIDRVKSFEF